MFDFEIMDIFFLKKNSSNAYCWEGMKWVYFLKSWDSKKNISQRQFLQNFILKNYLSSYELFQVV